MDRSEVSALNLSAEIATGSTQASPVPYYVVAAIVSLVAALILASWTTLQALQRGWRFTKLIRRELEEIGPHPTQPDPNNPARPWWEYATRRTVHEEIFRTERIVENRDFILGLDPTTVYQVSQLWLALQKRDGHNWMHFLAECSGNRRLASEDLAKASRRWAALMRSQPQHLRETMGVPTPYRQSASLNRAAELFKARLTAYGKLLPLLNPRSMESGHAQPRAVAERMLDWYYQEGNGLLLSGRALDQFRRTREALERSDETSSRRDVELSQLRTDLKIDLGVRQPQERGIDFPWPEDERW
ncbi:hypothetical protein PHK61_31290 [Actinomycetospora lutea]|uniref:hypothetical protein n=1 Tax=Actinomycetospora lutea TaxID=663604 RepID=UPI0023656C6C|nr:hypothetical protein [Actinomycetospora lutea]MDD7942904.1 hypothetical protein [Actinomycetospora lutea]